MSEPTTKFTFSSLCDYVEYLIYKEDYTEALKNCSDLLLLPHSEFSLRAKLYKAKCHFKLGMNAEYADFIQNAKLSHPGCHNHIEEFQRQLENTQPSSKLKQGALFRTFKGWERIEAELEENKILQFQKYITMEKEQREKKREELGAGDTSIV